MAKFILTSTGQLINPDHIVRASIRHGPVGRTVKLWFVNDLPREEGLDFDGTDADEVIDGLMEHGGIDEYPRPAPS